MRNQQIEQPQLPAKNVRWRILLAGFLLALVGGFSYSWGVLVLPLMEKYGWTRSEAILPFTTFMVIFSLVMVPAGKLQDRYGPKNVSAVGGVLFFVAYGLAAFVGYYPFAWWLVVTYGLIGGTACGLTYACVAPSARKWFPDKPAFAVSSTLMGFGLSALVFAPLKSEYLIPVHGIERTLLFIGVLILVVVLLASRMIQNPPEGWTPPNWKPTRIETDVAQVKTEFSPKEILNKRLFWMIWVTMALMISGGLMSIGLIPAYGSSVGLTSAEAALVLSIFSGFNGFGRPLAGSLADRFGIMRVMIVTYSIQTATLLIFPIFAVNQLGLSISAALLGWGFAVTLGLFPVLTSICFGVKHLGFNYGLVFTAFGVGALAPSLGSWFAAINGGEALAFFAAGVLAAVGLALCIIMYIQRVGR
jgi:OFA family oxalate/formate antiporter-like MFS transporter